MGSRSPKTSSETSSEERKPETQEQNKTIENIDDEPSTIRTAHSLLDSSTNSSTSSLQKQTTKLSVAKKVAGGWWSQIKNRKASADRKRQMPSDHSQQLYETNSISTSPGAASFKQSEPTDVVESSSIQDSQSFALSSPSPPPSAQQGSLMKISHSRKSESGIDHLGSPSSAPKVLVVDASSPQSQNPSASKKSGRRATFTAASPRSRRSSLYSFDIDVDTPRSDAFDIPMPSTSASPTAIKGPDKLTISPLSLNSSQDSPAAFVGPDGLSAIAISPGRLGHTRGKSNSSVRRSRPVSINSATGPSPRVSKRFSKRASILPPAALDLLKESEPVPQIPEQWRTPTTANGANSGFPNSAQLREPSPPPYELKQHAYAIRGLREYEDCLDEWDLFVVRAKEEEGVDGREVGFMYSLNSLADLFRCIS